MSANKVFQLLEALEPRVQFSSLTHTTGILPEARRGGVAAAAGPLIVVAGGEVTYASLSTTADVYDTRRGTWFVLPLPHPGGFKSAVASGGKAYFSEGIGAQNSDSRHLDVYAGGAGFRSGGLLSVGRSSPAGATLGDTPIFVGGRSTIAVQTADIFNAKTGRRRVVKLPVGIDDGKGTTAGQAAFFTTVIRGVLDKYDAVTRRWSTITIPGEVVAPSPVIIGVGTKLLIYGSRLDLVKVDIYDTVTRLWSSASLSQARIQPAVTAVGAKAIFAGGVGLATAPYFSDVVDIYDAATGNWSTDTLATPRDSIAAGASGRTAIFAGGGINVLGATKAIDIFTDTAPSPVLSGSLTGAVGHRDQVTVQNTGDADLPAGYTIQLYATPDRTLGGAILVGSRTMSSSLAAGASSPFNIRSVIPKDMPAGSYHLLAAVQDSSGHITPIAAQNEVFSVRGSHITYATNVYR